MTAAERPDAAPLLERAFQVEPVEGENRLRIEGEVPSYLRGTYYLNGPSRFRRGDLEYRHWLDGDGMVSSLRFADGDARLVQRFVRSTKLVDEEAAGRALYRAFGTAFDGDRLKRGIALESPANVSAFRWRDTLLAFGEQGLPFELDPDSLETRGEYTFGGRLNAISPLSAHPCFEDATGDLLNFGISFSQRQPSLTLYRFSAADGDLVYRKRHALDYPCSTHDFMISGEHVIFFLSPYLLDVEGLMAGGRSIMDGLQWRPERRSKMLVLDLATGERRAQLDIGDRFCLHLINAFEDPEGRLVVDVVELDRPVYDQYQVLPDLFTDEPRGRPVRRLIDRDTWRLVDSSELGYTLCSDFPAVDPRRSHAPYDDFWLLGISRTGEPGRKFFDQVAHLSWAGAEPDLYQAPPRHYLGGEPVFLGDPEHEGRGCVLCQEFDAESRSSSFLLFDAFRVAGGPIARLHLEHPMPLGFHATYYPEPA